MYIAALITIVVLAIAAELVARYVLGLGDPPLLMPDEQIEYLAQPSKTYRRFGNRIAYNRWSMRCDDFPQQRSDPRELRMLVMGDSVVNGGARVDQSQICTAIIQRQLAAELNRTVTVANISCGSWGPPNLLAYVKRFGLFDADVAVIVISSHDVADVPAFGAFGPDAPTRRPLLALQELAQKAAARVRAKLAAGNAASASKQPNPAHVEWSMNSLRELINACRDSGLRVLICQHLERGELGNPMPGHHTIRCTAEEMGVGIVQLGPVFSAAVERGENPYLDSIHPSATGHTLMAETIVAALRQIL